MAKTLWKDTGSPKKSMPLAATGSLFRAPTILRDERGKASAFVGFALGRRKTSRQTHLNVVDDVVRKHQAVVYEMKTAAAPETHIANRRAFLDSGGLRKGSVCESQGRPATGKLHAQVLGEAL